MPSLDFYWEAPEAGFYTIYASEEPNSVEDPVGPDWSPIHIDYYSAGECHWSIPGTVPEEFQIFVILYTP